MWLIYLLAWVTLIQSGLHVLLQVIASVIIIFQMARIYLTPYPESGFNRLEYCNHQWILRDKIGCTQIYTKHRVLTDMGLFFLLHLSAENCHKTLIIFFDQISPDDYRSLRILEKIN